MDLLGSEFAGESNVRETYQGMHKGELTGMIELEARNTLAIGKNGWFGQFPQLTAIHEGVSGLPNNPSFAGWWVADS